MHNHHICGIYLYGYVYSIWLVLYVFMCSMYICHYHFTHSPCCYHKAHCPSSLRIRPWGIWWISWALTRWPPWFVRATTTDPRRLEDNTVSAWIPMNKLYSTPGSLQHFRFFWPTSHFCDCKKYRAVEPFLMTMTHLEIHRRVRYMLVSGNLGR